MIDRRQHRFNSGDRLHGGGWSARDHHHLDTQPTGSLDLRISRRTAAVFGHQGVDAMIAKQRNFTINIVRAAVEDELNIGKDKRWLDRIDASHEVEVLGRDFGAMRFLATDRQEDPARRGAKPLNRFCNGRSMRPTIAWYSHPFRAAQRECGNADRRCGLTGVCGDAHGKGMRCVDQHVEATIKQKSSQAVGATKTADATRNRLIGRFFRSTSKREQDLVPAGVSERLGKSACFTSASQHQDADFTHV